MKTLTHHRNLSIATALLSLTLLTSCGGTASGVILTANELSSALTTNTIDETTEALPDNSAAASASVFSVEPLSAGLTVSSDCSKDNTTGVVTVTRTYSGSDSETLTLPRITATVALTGSGTVTRTWTPPSAHTTVLSCTTAAKAVKFDWTSATTMDGLTMSAVIDRTRNRSVERTVTKALTGKSTTTTKTDNYTVKGTRTFSWTTSSASVASGHIAWQKTVTLDMARTRTFTAAAGEATLATTVKTKSDAPLVVDVERVQSTYALVKKTVKSGTIVSQKVDGGRVESSFSNVVYDMTSDNPCLPTGGTITGSVYADSSSTTATSTFTITFGADTESTISISRDGATAEDFDDYTPKGCDLEQDS